MNFKYSLPSSLYDLTIAKYILSEYPYNEIVDYLPLKYKLLDDFLDAEEILHKFKKYFVDSIDNTKLKHSLIMDK